MNKIAVVTDSGANLSPEQIVGLPIHQVPFQLVWGGQTYRDGIDMTATEFYARLRSDGAVHPTTSQPQPKAFYDVFKSLVEQGYQVLGIITSSRLSGSFSSAVQACKMLPNALIHLVDSRTIAMEMGFHVLEAARAAVRGATLAECRALAERARERSGVFFIVNTLEYLHRGGRIGGAAAFLGSLFSIKPILQVLDGRVDAAGKVRTTRKAVESMVQMVCERVRHHRRVRFCALYADERERAEEILSEARVHFEASDIQVDEAFCSRVTPVIGVHTGPDGVGLAYLAGG